MKKPADAGFWFWWSGLAPTGEILSFACPKERIERKGPPAAAVLRTPLRCSPDRAAIKLALARQAKAYLTAELEQVIAEIPRPGCAAQPADGRGEGASGYYLCHFDKEQKNGGLAAAQGGDVAEMKRLS